MSEKQISQDIVKDFFDWRYNAREFYENVTMYALPEHPVSINFLNETICAEDSYVHGIVLGLYDEKKGTSSISLCNVLFPNRNSISFDKNHPNEQWGKVQNKSKFTYKGKLNAANTNAANDILASVDSDLIYIGQYADTKINLSDDKVTKIQFVPTNSTESVSRESFLGTENRAVLHYKGPSSQSKPSTIQRFKKVITDISIDPYNTQTCLVSHGAKKINFLDARDSTRTSIALNESISSLAYSPHIPFMFSTGSTNGIVGFYDLRYPKSPILQIPAHDSIVSHVIWSPDQRDIVTSSSDDSAIVLCSIIESKEIKDDNNIVFAHNGHLTPITDFDWCKDIPWTLASVSQDNLFEVWTIAPSQIDNYFYHIDDDK